MYRFVLFSGKQFKKTNLNIRKPKTKTIIMMMIIIVKIIFIVNITLYRVYYERYAIFITIISTSSKRHFLQKPSLVYTLTKSVGTISKTNQSKTTK